MRVDLRAEVAKMPPQEARDYLLDFFDWLYPKAGAVWRLEGVDLTPQGMRMLRCLWEAKGGVVRHGAIAAAIWGERSPDDWPEQTNIPVRMCQFRNRLQGTGITITAERGVGYSVAAPEGFVWQWVRVA